MARPIVKYLDPVSGEYEFATVIDMGDLGKLNTSVKSDIVSAINSIVSEGVGSPNTDHRINQLEQVIKSLQDGTFEIINFNSIDEYLRQEFLDTVNGINEQNKLDMEAILIQLDTHVNEVIQDYQEKVTAQNVILENAQNTLLDAKDTLESKAAELEMANIGFTELEYDFNELDNYISTNVRTIDFDNFNAMTEDYKSVVTQASNEVGVDMKGSTLSYLTGRVTDAEASISAQANEITSKMSYEEFQYMPIPKYKYNENLLFNTFDFSDMWIGKNGAQVTADTFLFGKVIAFNSPTGRYETVSDDLTVGDSYVFTTYVNVQPSDKSPSESKFEPISSGYSPTDFRVQIGAKSFNPSVYEDLSGINGWVRIQQEFVADAVNPFIAITPVGVNGSSELAYMAMPKLEAGLKVTPWQPHAEDEYATLSSTQSMIKQQADSIVAFVTGVEQLDDSYKQATSTFQMLADGFAANTEAIEAYEDAVTRYGTEYSNINGKFEQRVWKDDFEAVIEDINIDNRNRVLNSDFIRNEINPSTRKLIVEDWSISEGWSIKSTENTEYLSRERTGALQVLASTATSSYFPIRHGEKVLFSFELIHSDLDNDNVFAIELFDIANKRLLKKEFSLSTLTQVNNRYHGSFRVQTTGAEKANVVLQVPKNGKVQFTRISLQNADIGSTDWSPAPEDSWIIQSKLASYISQVEDEVKIGAVGRKLDTLTGLLTEDEGTFTLNPDKIATEVRNSQTYDEWGLVDSTNFEQTASGWMNEITSDGRLAGYINASPDTYRISFDKIILEGTTWADALGSSRITVTDKFALIGKNGRPVLDVTNDGSVNMNVSSLNIGPYTALTTNDKSSIKDEVTQNVINTTEPYIHIAYADTINGDGLVFTPTGKQYIGFAKSHLPTPSATASNYVWSKYVGSNGTKGTDGIGISGTIIEYASSADGNNYPTTGWKSTIPNVPINHFLWTKTLWQYTDNTIKVAYSVSKVGKDGTDGKGIVSTITSYANHTNGTTAPSTGWTSSIPEPIKGQYQWTRTVINYTTGEPTTGYSVSYIPLDGQRGLAGNGVTTTIITYAQTDTNVKPTGSAWKATMPTPVKGKYLWTRTIIKYSDNTESEAISVAYQAIDGYTPVKGIDYDDGVSITGITEYYLASALKTGVTTSSSFPWSTTMPTLSASQPYLWNYETTQLSNGTSTAPTVPVIIGMYSEDGISITGVSNQYALGTSNTTAPKTGWSDIPKPTTPEMKYLWNYEIISYSKGSPTETPKVVIGTHGASGSDGNPGKDGVGLKSTTLEYVSSTSGTVRPISGWNTTIPYVAPGDFLWTRTTWLYTDNTSEYGYSVSRIGKDGNKGDDGAPGKDGVGVDETTIEYSTSLNGAVYPSSGWQATVPTVPDNHFLWTRTRWHYTDDTTEVAYSVSKVGKDGTDGKGISKTEIRYANHTSGTIAPTTGWVQNIPEPVKGQYQWTRTYVEYTTGNPTTSYSVSYIPLDGQRGNSGNGVIDSTVTYAQTDTNVKPGASSWLAVMPTPAPGKYLWTRTVITYTDGSSSEAVSVAYQAIDGYTPVKGKDYFDGKNGISITSVVEKYKLSTLSVGETTSGSWNNTPKTPTKQLPYLWNYEIINYSEGNPTITQPAVIGMYSADGTSIASIKEFYALSTSTARPTEASFTETMKVTDEVNKYLWNKEVITLRHDDGSTTPETSYAIIGVHGKAGNDGIGISSTVIEYSVSSSGTAIPTSGWVGTIPSVNPGQYLWTRTKWTYTNSNVEYAYSVAYEGKNGGKGDAGVGIASTVIDYISSTSGTTTPTGTWSATIPTVAAGSFLWTRTRWTYTDSSTQTGYSVSRAARDGVSITSVVEKYKLSTLQTGETTAGTWDNTPKTPTRQLPYLWNYEIINYSSGSPTVTTPAVIGMYSSDGTSIVGIEELYALSTTTTQPADSAFTPGMKITTETNKYLWNKEIITLKHDDGSLDPQVHYALIGTHGASGYTPVKGKDYDDGVGISSTVIDYAVSSSGTATPTSGWVGTVPTVGPGKFLWTRTKWVYTDNRTEFAYSVSYEGKNGAPGNDGVGVRNTVIEYATSTSGTVTPTSGWGSTVPSDSAGKFLWTKTLWEYSDNTFKTAYSVSRVGQDGKGVSSSVVSYQSHTSGTSTPTGSWLATIPTVNQGEYLWTRTMTTYTDGQSVPTYSVSYYAKNGLKGESGIGIASSLVHYARSTSGTTAPSTGWTTAIPSPVKGEYLWTRTSITYTDGDSSTAYSTSYYAKDGAPGNDGQSQYVHLRYSANSSGTGFVPTPTSSTKYIGIAVTTSSTAPTSNTGYTWSKYAGDNGSPGLPGAPGVDGTTTYTWVKYADTETGIGLHDSPAGKKYIGLAFNKTTATESLVASEYQWSLLPQNIEVGGRNLLLQSKLEKKNTSYPTAIYTMSEKMIAGQKYTIRLKGTLGEGKSSFGAWIDGGSISLGSLKNEGNGFYSMTFTGKAGSRSDYNTINIYPVASSVVVESTIEWIKLEKGDIATDWTPAPEDLEGEFSNVRDRMTEAESALSQMTGTLEDISADISEFSSASYMTSDDYYNSLMEELATFEANINIGPLRTTTASIDQNFTFSEQGMIVGSETQKSKVRIANDRIELINENKVASYIVGGTMYADDFVATKGITLLNHSVTSVNNKTVFKYVGS